MQSVWMAIRPSPGGARLLAMQGAGETILKAKLLSNPSHPRALQTLLEGLALWQGHKVHAALCADESPRSSATSHYPDLFTDPADTLLYAVDWVPVTRARKRRRRNDSGGLGDFRDLRQLVLWEVLR
ncbi:MAG: hypothetical protein HOW73_22560 [Polyangiaceae bacterium]|nr:hypothetical protein [Polyangiaceae bacterium]